MTNVEHLLLGIDPGEVKCACALIRVPEGDRGDAVLEFGLRVDTDTLVKMFERLKPKGVEICMEEFLLYPQMKNLKAHRFSRMKTSQSIGVIKHYTKLFSMTVHEIRAVEHKTKVRGTTYLQRAGLWGEYNLVDADHIRDATSIAVYCWRNKGIFNRGDTVVTDTDRRLLGLEV